MKTTIKNDILGYSTAIIASLIPAIIFSKYLEAFIFVICHTLIRPQFKRQYHHIIPSMCRLITGVIAFLGISFVLQKQLSILSAICINYLIAWVGCLKATSDYYEVKYKELKYNIRKQKRFNTDTCTKDELVARCNELKFSKDKINLSIELFINKTKQSKLADMLCVNEKSIQQYKRRLKQKLNNKM